MKKIMIYKKRGISLIVLVITIVVMIILAGAVIISMVTNNPIFSARNTVFKNNISAYIHDLNEYKNNKYNRLAGDYDSVLLFATKSNATYDNELIDDAKNMQDIIPSMSDEDTEKFEVRRGELVYIGDDENEKKLAKEMNLEVIENTWANNIPETSASYFKYIENEDGTITITGFDDSISDYPTQIRFPSKINGKTVTAIDSSAFYNNTNIVDVVIPGTITNIEQGAFDNCSTLTRIEFEYGVKNIENYAFNNCSNLQEVNIPASVNNISTSAFSNCTDIESITIPQYVAGITGVDSIFYSAKTSLKTVDFSGSITSITDSCFLDFIVLENIELPDSVQSIGDYAFRNCAIKTINIPESTKTIGAQAFSISHDLTEIDFPENSNLEELGDDAFNMTGLTGILKIPEGVRVIGNNAFANCHEITEVILPSTLTSVTSQSFQNCDSIVKITVPQYIVGNLGVKTVFSYSNTKIETVEFTNDVSFIAANSFEGFTALKNITLPNSVTVIGDYAFRNCTSLTRINIPANTIAIGVNAFSNDLNLATVDFSECVNLLQIKDNAFAQTGITGRITLPEGLKIINSYAFGDSSKITEVILPSTITSISSNTFLNDSNITKIKYKTESVPDGSPWGANNATVEKQ